MVDSKQKMQQVQQDIKIVDKYVITTKELGRGSFGKVYRGYKQEDPTFLVAVKQISVALMNKDCNFVKLLSREIEILNKINNPHIVKLIHKTRTTNNIYIFLEYCNGGDLSQLIKKRGGQLAEQEAVLYFKQIVEGFRQLHQENIMHRDIKPANILLHDGQAKISDFGFARVVEDMNNKDQFTILGSPLYMPVQILQKEEFSSKCDIWSLGILFYELLYGRTPWTAKDPESLKQNILTQPLKFPDQPIRSQVIKDLVFRMLQVQEEQRIRWDELFNHNVMQLNEGEIINQIQTIQQSQMDDLEKAEKLNQLYVQINKVKNTGDQNIQIQKMFAAQKQMDSQLSEQGSEVSSQQSSSSDVGIEKNLSNHQILITQDRKLQERKIVLKIDAFLTFKRNVGIFLNVSSTSLYQIFKEGSIKFSNHIFYRIIFALQKYQMILFSEISKILQSKIPIENGFTEENWKHYKNSNEYTVTLSAIKSEIQVIKSYFNEIFRKCSDYLSNPNLNANQNELQEIQEFKQIMTQELVLDEKFQTIYEFTISQVLKIIAKCLQSDNSFKQNQKAMTTTKYLKMCIKPFSEFKWERFSSYQNAQGEERADEFNKFYEKYENLDQHQLLMELKEDLMDFI